MSIPAVRDGRRTSTDRLRAAGIAFIALLVFAGAAAQFLNYGLDLRAGVLDASDDGGAFGLVGQIAPVSYTHLTLPTTPYV